MTTETTRDGLLAAIRDNPEDDTPRLILADWFDENAASGADRARAEFIRVQIERARLPEADDRQAELEARERRLMIAHGLEWFGKETLSSFTFRRGFPHCYRGDSSALIADGEDVLARHPIRELDAGGSYKDRGKPFDESEPAPGDFSTDLAGITVLDLAGDMRSLTPLKRALAILACPTLTGLRELRLGRAGEYGDDGVALILDSPAVQNLESLNLAGLHLTDAGLADFLTRPWPRLRRLDLSHNSLTLDGLRRLFASDLWTRLRDVDLSANFEEWPNTDELIPAVERANAERLILSGLGGWNPSILRALLQAKTWGPVRTLGLGYFQMEQQEVRRLLAHPSTFRLAELELDHNRLSAKTVDLIAGSPALANLTRLDLTDNRLAEAAVGRLAGSRYVTQLTYLRASYGAGLAEFVASPNAAHVRRLAPGCHATDELFEALAASPYVSNLTSLFCNSGKITDRGAAALASSRQLKNLTYLDLLGCRQLTEEGLRPLLRAESLGWIEGIEFYGKEKDLWATNQTRYRGFYWKAVLAPNSERYGVTRVRFTDSGEV
jgi:uncharacterized protein (TIGR02996 family)